MQPCMLMYMMSVQSSIVLIRNSVTIAMSKEPKCTGSFWLNAMTETMAKR